MTTGDPMGGETPENLVLELRGVSRQFGAVRALTNVSFDCRAGEVHALVGENGSGKSTLLGIASGFVEPDLGHILIGGKALRTDSPAMARGLGLAMAYQDLSLIQAEPVKNNLFLAAPPGKRSPYWNRKRWARKHRSVRRRRVRPRAGRHRIRRSRLCPRVRKPQPRHRPLARDPGPAATQATFVPFRPRLELSRRGTRLARPPRPPPNWGQKRPRECRSCPQFG